MYRLGLMVLTRTHYIDIDSWYSIGTFESDTYKRAECCLYVGYFSALTHVEASLRDGLIKKNT